MAGEWKRVAVDEVCELIVDCVNKTAPVVEGLTPYKMLRTTNIKGGRIDREECRHVSKETFVKWTRRADVRRGDVILTREAPLGEVGYVDFDDTVFLGQRLMQYRPNPALLEPRFLLYSFLSKDLQNQFGAHEGSGSTVSHIRVGDCSKFQLSLPPLAEQKAIAAVLGALDDKIELNRRMNATLEAMARALFQSWFVDFDPVRAKLDEREPVGVDPDTAAVFPDSFQETEAGHIPKGWSIEPVGQVVECVGGGTPSTSEPKYWEGGRHHWTTPKDFSSLQAPILLDTARKLTDAGISRISSGLLPAGTLLLSSRAPVGYLAIASMPVAINQGFIALKCNHRATNFFMLNWCYTNIAEIQSRATGTTFAEISKQNFRPIGVLLPPMEVMAAFTAKVAPLYAQITANLHISRTLASLRDSLLPKLISGEMKIADVDQILFTNTP
jgi:type I restriction enzyme S subunit